MLVFLIGQIGHSAGAKVRVGRVLAKHVEFALLGHEAGGAGVAGRSHHCLTNRRKFMNEMISL